MVWQISPAYSLAGSGVRLEAGGWGWGRGAGLRRLSGERRGRCERQTPGGVQIKFPVALYVSPTASFLPVFAFLLLVLLSPPLPHLHYQPWVLLPPKEARKCSSANAADDKGAAQWASLGKAGLAGIDWVMSREGRPMFPLVSE